MAHIRVHTSDDRLLPQIIKFTTPLILTNLFQQAYAILDNMIAGKFAGELTLAAVGATSYLSAMILNMVIGIAVGISTVIAQMEGEQNPTSIRKSVHTAMMLSLVSGLALGVIGVVFAKPMLSLMQTPDTIIDQSAAYTRIYFSGLIFNAIYNFGAAILRAKGDTKRPLIYLSLSGAIKVALSLLFVVVFKGGAAALAFSTVISQIISAVLVANALRRETGAYQLCLRELKIHTRELGRILRSGLPIGLQSCSLSLSNIILQASINSFGDIAVAGATAAITYNNLFYSALTGMSHTATIFGGRNFGAKRYDRVTQSLLGSSLLVMVIGGVIAAVCFPFATPLVRLFVDNPIAVSHGAGVVRVLCLTYWLSGLMEVVSGGLRAINKSIQAMITTVVCLCLVRIVWIYTYFANHRALDILYYSYPISWFVTLAVSFVLFQYYFRRITKGNQQALPL